MTLAGDKPITQDTSVTQGTPKVQNTPGTQNTPGMQNAPGTQDASTTQDQPTARDTRVMRLYYTLGIGGITVVVVLLLLVRWMVDVEKYHTRIVTSLENMTGHSVSLGDVVFAPAGGFFTLELRDLEIHAHHSMDPPLLLVKKVQMGISPFSFFYEKIQNKETDRRSPLEISSLTLIRPRFHLRWPDTAWPMRSTHKAIRQGDHKSAHKPGRSPVDVFVGSIRIQRGTMTLAGWQHVTEHPLVFDQIQADIHALSFDRASPVSTSARFQSIPFTINGQVGPLPTSLDPTALPVLLSLEAKSAKLPQLSDLFANLSSSHTSTIRVRGARGYFSTLFNGSLTEGMRTSSRLEVDGLRMETSSTGKPASPDAHGLTTHTTETQTPTTPPPETQGPPPPKRSLSTVSWSSITKGSAPTIDVALRQKSVLGLENGNPSFQIEEFFLHLDRQPVLDIKGVFGHGTGGLLDLELATLKPIDWVPFLPMAPSFISGGHFQGALHIHGSWPDSIALSANLDLSQTALTFPSQPVLSHRPAPGNPTQHQPSFMDVTASWLHKVKAGKKSGIPLFLDMNMVREKNWHRQREQDAVSLTLEHMVFSRSPLSSSKPPKQQFRLSGMLQPSVDLTVVGAWELSLLKDFLPTMTTWNASGLARMQMTLASESHDTQNLPVMEGYVRSDKGDLGGVGFQDFFTRIQLKDNLLHLSGMEIQAGSGRLDGHLLADLSGPNPSYHALFAFTGVVLEQLVKPQRKNALHLEGLAFGQGNVRGSLNQDFLPEEPFSGNIHLTIEPGRITGLHGSGVDGDLFLQLPEDAQIIVWHEQPTQPTPDDLASTGEDRLSHDMIRRQENPANPKKALYWNRIETDILLHNALFRFDNLQLKAAGLKIFGSGEWRLSGEHWFDLVVHPSLQKGADSRFSAWVEGDRHKTIYHPQPRSPTHNP